MQIPVDARATCRGALPAYACPVARLDRSAAMPMGDPASRAQPARPLAPMEIVLVRSPAAPAAVVPPLLPQACVLVVPVHSLAHVRALLRRSAMGMHVPAA